MLPRNGANADPSTLLAGSRATIPNRHLRCADKPWILFFNWGYGATVARLTPDQKVGSSNLSALIFQNGYIFMCSPCALNPPHSSNTPWRHFRFLGARGGDQICPGL